MTKLDLGPIGVTLNYGDWEALLDAAPELEELGYSTIWVSGGQIDDLGRIADVVRATRKVPVATGIIPVDVFPSDAVAEAYAEIEGTHPGRFVVGLGGAHGPKPLQTLGGYLDRLDEAKPRVPEARRVLAALGPRMLDLARDRTAGACPLLVTPEYAAQARALLGGDSMLAVQQCVVLDTDATRAREAARELIGFLGGVTGYPAHLRRMGFGEDEVTQLSDRLVDALVAWGDEDTINARVSEHLEAGADHVAVTVLNTTGSSGPPLEQWRQLANALITRADRGSHSPRSRQRVRAPLDPLLRGGGR
ncbi:MAG: LLM class F420-dependent oxidoreductase [Nocardioidaceae bacterium]|nr:LLM class F420-dependent oxidoreductase [Nocardioidaceae bacterium]